MLKKLKKNRRHFIFDISSGYVSGAVIFLEKKSRKPILEFSTKISLNISTVNNLKTLQKNTVLALDQVCKNIENFMSINTNSFLIDSGSVFLSPPWISFDNYVLIDEKIKAVKITEPYLENILDDNFKKNVSKKAIKKNKVLINSQIINVQANDYPTNIINLLNQKVSKIEISILDTFINSYSKELLEKTINNHFGLLKLNFHSFLPVLFNQIKNIYDPEDDFIFLHLTDVFTDFGIFNNNKIKNLSSFPLGKNTILKKIVENKITTDLKAANSILNMYWRKELEFKLEQNIDEILNSFKKKLKSNLKETLEKLQSFNVPLYVFILASRETKFLLTKLELFEKQQKIIFLDEKLIRNFVDGPDEYFDPFLALETEFVYT